jgi:hypothetical protein
METKVSGWLEDCHMLGMYAGYRIIESAAMVDSIDHGPKRKHRQKRIAKKWLKKYGRNIEVRPKQDVYLIKNPGAGAVICHPVVARKIKEALKAASQKSSSYSGFGSGFLNFSNSIT